MLQNQSLVNSTAPLDRSRVAEKAYQLWERAGRPLGRDMEFWLLAEKDLRAAAQPVNAPQPAASAEVAPLLATPSARAAAPRVTTPKLSGSRATVARKRKASL